MIKKILPVVMGAMVAAGLAASAQAGTLLVKVKCSTDMDLDDVYVEQRPSNTFDDLGDCPAGGNIEETVDLIADTHEVGLVAGDTVSNEYCWLYQGNEILEQYNAKDKCLGSDFKIKLKFKTED